MNPPPTARSAKVAIIGAGPAGLTAAYLLSKQGVPVTVLESDPDYVGGISRTAIYKGFQFDIGGHRFFSKSKEVEDLWTEILPDDMFERPRSSRIFYNGQFFSYPLNAREALFKLGVWRIRLCACFLSSKPRLFPSQCAEVFRGLGDQSVRRAALPHLLQDLHREGVGHELQGDLGRLGGPAHQGPVAEFGHPQRPLSQTPAQGFQEGDQDPDRYLPLSPQRPRHDVGNLRGQGPPAGRRNPHGAGRVRVCLDAGTGRLGGPLSRPAAWIRRRARAARDFLRAHPAAGERAFAGPAGPHEGRRQCPSLPRLPDCGPDSQRPQSVLR